MTDPTPTDRLEFTVPEVLAQGVFTATTTPTQLAQAVAVGLTFAALSGLAELFELADTDPDAGELRSLLASDPEDPTTLDAAAERLYRLGWEAAHAAGAAPHDWPREELESKCRRLEGDNKALRAERDTAGAELIRYDHELIAAERGRDAARAEVERLTKELAARPDLASLVQDRDAQLAEAERLLAVAERERDELAGERKRLRAAILGYVSDRPPRRPARGAAGRSLARVVAALVRLEKLR